MRSESGGVLEGETGTGVNSQYKASAYHLQADYQKLSELLFFRRDLAVPTPLFHLRQIDATEQEC